MVVDRDKVEDRIDQIRRYQRDLRDFGNISRDDFRGNRERQYAVFHAMQNAIEACIEIASQYCTLSNPSHLYGRSDAADGQVP